MDFTGPSTPGIKDNPKAPGVRFIRVRGRVIPIFSGNKKGVKPKVAAALVEDQLQLFDHKVEVAQKGERIHKGYGTDHEVIGSGSTYPKFYGEIGFRSKAHFKKALEQPGLFQKRLINEAVESIEKSPQKRIEFGVATRQIFDNRGVSFRKIGGIVRPIRSNHREALKPKADPFAHLEEAPF